MEEDEAIKSLLHDNEPESSLKGTRFLLVLLNDIICNRRTSIYINIPVRGKVFEEHVLPINGVMQCLFSVGYEEGEDSFYLPNSVSIKRIESLQEKLNLKIVALNQRKVQFCINETIHTSKAKNVDRGNFAAADRLIQEMDVSFKTKVLSNANFVFRYEDKALQTKAQRVIPIDKLKRNVMSNHFSLQPPKSQLHFKDCLLLELLAWFKHSFFKWVDAEFCDKCQMPGIFCGTTNPTSEELCWDANRVELLKCPTCSSAIRFPRYNHPEKLLETRKGRCGEWANCFTLCCRALGFDARFVVDWNDHVWTEVYSDHENRWLHCDPCENICDKPLLYESGWGKKMAYVLAFSRYEVQDVTWRYSSFHEDVLTRRTLCNESFLLELIMKLTDQRQRALDETTKKKLLLRRVTELVEFLAPKNPVEQEMGGRTSGSLTWREERHEVRPTEPYCFVPKDKEIANKTLHVKYSPVLDKYIRVTDGNSETQCWQACTSESTEIFRKIESDWNMVYLARKAMSSKGTISWKFDFTASGLVVDSLQICCPITIFENGFTVRTVSNGRTTVNLESDNNEVKEMEGSSWFLLKVELAGGTGPVGWQHAQLFRMSLMDKTFPFTVKVLLKSL